MFKKEKNYVFVLSLCFNLLLIKFTVYNFSILGVAAVNEWQHQEIQHLKSELSEALEKENRNAATKGVIVQPIWTESTDKSSNTKSARVEVNEQNRNEAAAIRAEIEQAVIKDSFATAGALKMQDIQALEDSLNANKMQTLVTMSKSPASGEERVGAGSGNSEDGHSKPPNVVTASVDVFESEIDIRKLQRFEVSKRRTREVLVLKYIEEDFSFEFGHEVNEWKHIVHAGQEYFIGRRVTDLLIVRKDIAEYERAIAVDVGQIISHMETITYWNSEQEQQEGIILIAVADKVLWYRANNETKQIELYWEWVVGNSITGLTCFTLDSKDYLAVSSNQSFFAGHYALNIYQYKLETKEFWIAQRLQLQFSYEEITVLDSGRDVILAIPQNNTAAIYTFNPHEAPFSHLRFDLKKSVDAEGILTIAGFKMGGRSYLALTGYQPQILLYQQGDFISKTILGNNFGLVELFFPIPIRTYRDDLILLVQHRVDFTTHFLTVVETLIWDGEAFETSIPVPCHLGQHVVYGAGCVLDLQRNEGLKGATLLKRGDITSVIVPRYKAESGLFIFHTELLAKNSELVDLQEVFNFLKNWIKEQDELIAQAETFLQIPDEELAKQQTDLALIESLETPEFQFDGEVGEIYVNDYKWTLEDTNIDLELIIQNLEDLEKSFSSGRQRRNLDDASHNELSFDEVIVDDLELKKVNGQEYFIQNGELNFQGLIHFSELEVLERFVDLRKRQVNDDDFILEGDLEFEKINGIAWSDINDNLVFKTLNQNLEEVEVKGEVFVEDSLTINTLNGLNFPNDFMLSNGPDTSTVTAEKHFVNTLSATSVDANGYVNGKNPLDAITLTDPQEWEGTATFKYLEVSEVLELHGRVQGHEEDPFPQNPTLEETKTVKASCHFNELMVNGPIILKDKMDDQSLGLRLKDILLKPSNPTEEILVPSVKSFDSITFPINFQIESNAINSIRLDDFVTVHTKQTLNITSLEGSVYFYNLTLNGSYDGIKIDDILKEVILLEEPIDLSTTELLFPQELKGNSISILDTINQQPIKDNLQTLREDFYIKSAEFESLQTLQADFSRDILGQGKLNNIELHAFVNEKSWHEPPIRGNIFLNELILTQGLQTDELHGIRAEYLLDFLNQIDELPDMVLNGHILVDHIKVTGDVQLHKLNDLLFEEEIQLTSINLQHPNNLPTNIIFKNRLDIKGQLNVLGDFRGNFLPDLIDDIIIRTTNACIDITAPKSFLNPVEVSQNTQVKALNGIPIENLAWKYKENNFSGSVHVKGNLIARNINFQGYINNFNWQDLENLLYFDEKLQNFVLKNTIEFKSPQFLEDLTVLGDLNDVENLSDFFANLIYKNQPCQLKGKNKFTGRVTIDQGAHIGNLNGQDLEYLFDNLVVVNGPQPIEVQTFVTFENSIHANEIQVGETLSVEVVSGCSIKEWLNNSLRVDQDQNVSLPLKFSSGSINGNSLSVHIINDKDLSRIITLNTPQTFNETVEFSKIVLSGFILSKGRINNLDLEMEFNNTLMTYGHQHICTPLTIQTVAVLGDLHVRGLVNNNKDLKDVATLQEDLIFESPLYFKSIYSPQVIINDLVTGIDLNGWFESVVRHQHTNTQYITGNWSTKHLTVGRGIEGFQYMITGFETWQYNPYLRLAKSDSEEVNEVDEICPLIKDIWQDVAAQPVFVKYVEDDDASRIDLDKQFRNTNETFDKMFHLKSNREHFLLINVKCKSFIYKWLIEENKFILEHVFVSGLIDEIDVIPVFRNSTKLEFLTNFVPTEKSSCSMKAVNKWKIENNSIVLDNGLLEASHFLYKSQGNDFSLWTLHNETIQELDLDYKIKQKWQLPVEQNKTRYRFVPLREEQEILLTNGENLVLLSKQTPKQVSFNTQEPKFFTTSYLENLKDSISQSILKPNTSLTSSFAFADFKHIIQRILSDLSQHLNQQVDITQLSIPESDLFDEHLLPDFLAIIDELRKQIIYAPEMFGINFDKLTLPQNPSQVLATRAVQISWPMVVEIEEIHSYLKSNESHDHPLCSNITKSLGFFIKDILIMANAHNSTKSSNDTTLRCVIKRIRTFDKDLENFVKSLESYNNSEIETKILEKDQLKQSATKRVFSIFSQNQNDSMILMEDSHLPGYKEGEILSLLVGSTSSPRRLWAVTNTKTSLAANNNNPGIFLYLEGLEGQLYQVISAIEPRSLQQLRVKQETLLLFVQECCQVRILKYRGSQGFTRFAQIDSDEHIKQIVTVALPSNQGTFKYFLILLLENKIKFYEFAIEGFDSAPASSTHLPSNCL